MHKVSLSQGLIHHFYCGSGTFGNFEISLKNLKKTYNFFENFGNVLEKFGKNIQFLRKIWKSTNI